MKTYWRKKIIVGCLAVTAIMGGGALPTAEAFNVDVLGSLVGGALQYKVLDDQISYYNTTEEGRQELFQNFKDKLGVSDNAYLRGRLDYIMRRVSEGVAYYDKTVYERPFLYFLNPEQDFNAFCSFGRVMSVNEGLFTLTWNEDELAVVLAHEMGHGERSHTASAARKQVLSVIGANVALSSMGANAMKAKVLEVALLQYNQVHIGKKMEWEADNLAMDYIMAAGYNPGAGAALWQRVEEKYGESPTSFVGEIFAPSDHPSHKERRLNYEKRVRDLSNGHVSIKGDMVQVNGKDFLSPASLADMSTAERKYFLMGNLAAAYRNGHAKERATVKQGTLMLGPQPIIIPVEGDPSAERLAALLNRIK